MSKRSNIRWSKSDNQELAKAVKNFNAKLTRIEKKNPEMKEALPDRMSVRQLKELIATRQDLKREINSLKRFSKRGSEEIETYGQYNVQITKWQRQDINRRVAGINRRRSTRLEYIKSLEVQQGGESLGYTVGQLGMGAVQEVDLQPLRGLTPGMNQRDVKYKYKHLLKESQSNYYSKKDIRARDNYIKGLLNEFKLEDIKEVIEAIEEMPIDEFLKTFYAEADASFEGIYRPNNDVYGSYVNQLKSIWIK